MMANFAILALTFTVSVGFATGGMVVSNAG